MKKRTLSSFVVVPIAVGRLAGCGGSPQITATTVGGTSETQAIQGGQLEEVASDSAPGKDSLVIAMASDILSMDPFKYDEDPTDQVMAHIYEAMVLQGPDMQFRPGLAESWETSKDGLVWTFHLREGVEPHDGEVMDSGDVLASINVAKDPDPPSVFSSYISTSEKIETPDANTVKITTKTPNPLMPSNVAQIYVLKQENVEGKTEEEISNVVVGTGCYKFAEQVKEGHLDMAVNEDYWGKAPPIKNVCFRPITNEAIRTATMLIGEVDFTIDISPCDIDRLENTEDISILKQQGIREICPNLNSREDSPLLPGQKNPMVDPEVRQAIYLTIGEVTIIKNIMNGCALEMNFIIPEGYVGYAPMEREGYDPEKAKQLLAEAGYPDGFKVILDVPNDRYMSDGQIVQAAVGFLERAGIKVGLNLMPKANFFTYIKSAENRSMLLTTGWSDASGGGLSLFHDMLQTFNRENGDGTVNRGHYPNTEVDALIKEVYMEMDDTERGELTAKAEKIARDDYAYIPLHFEQDTYAIKDTLDYTPRMNKYVPAWKFSYK